MLFDGRPTQSDLIIKLPRAEDIVGDRYFHARIAWDDGWHDAIRKRGSVHEKVAFEPGKTFDDAPSNVTAARNTQPKPI